MHAQPSRSRTLFQRLYKVSLVLALPALTLALSLAGILTGLSQQQAVQAASGDWPTYLADNGRSGYNPTETSINPSTAPYLKLHWKYQARGKITSEPVVANGMIYWGSWDGYEHASDLNGNPIWATNLGTTTDVNCKPASAGVASIATVVSEVINGIPVPVVFVGGGDANFYALNANTGAIIWQTSLGTPPATFIWSSPIVYNGSVYIGVSSFGDCPLVQGQLVQIDATTGIIEHSFNVVPNGCVGGGIWGAPTIDNRAGEIYVVTGTLHKCSPRESYAIAMVELHAADLTVVGYWQIPRSEQIDDSDFGSTPTLFLALISGKLQKLVGAVNKNGIYYAFLRGAISSGPVWRTTIANPGPCLICGQGSMSSSAWDGARLYVAGGITTIAGQTCQGSLRALDPATGGFLWEQCLHDGPVLAAVTAVPGVAVVGEGSVLNLVATATGQILFSYRSTLKIHFNGAASISKGVLYVGDPDGTLYAFGT